jgi:hypothetical protein
MISTGFEQRVKIQEVIDNQIPEFFLDENPKFSEFLKDYYKSQEYPGGPVDIAENLDQYLRFQSITPEVISGKTTLSSNITASSSEITVSSTKGFPDEYGLLKIDDEIITYKKIEGNKFTGCIRGFCGITSFDDPLNPGELIFSTSIAASHKNNSTVVNLSALFLQNFYKRLKYLFAPGFEDIKFTPDLNVDNFISQIKSFYKSKGTEESIKILFRVLYGEEVKVLNTEDFVLKPSSSEYLRRKIVIADLITKNCNPENLIGQEIRSNNQLYSGPVSRVDILTRNNKALYRIELFYGYDDSDLTDGNFKITPKTKITETVSVGSSIINVDSTVGFGKTGTFISNSQQISYTNKNLTQFFGCTGITSSIPCSSDLYFNSDVIYGYENGDINKKIEFIVTGSLSNISKVDNLNLFREGETISVKNYGDKILNPLSERSFKQKLFNSWVYNVKSRYEIQSYSNGSSQIVLYESPDKSSLKNGDYVDILKQNSEDIILENVLVQNINSNIVQLDTEIQNSPLNQKLSIRRNYKYASSSNIPLTYSKILSDVQNTYVENNDFIYVSSNSLPSYNITTKIKKISKTISQLSDVNNVFGGLNAVTRKYSTLSFDNEVPFITGDEVVYTHTTTTPISGLSNNAVYYVEVLDQKNKIKLYSSRSFLSTGDNIELEINENLGTHTFTLRSQTSEKLLPSNSLIKFPISQKYEDYVKKIETKPGEVGVLVNGVSIINYKSDDRIYYGPINNISVINSGEDYDVIDPPKVIISNPTVGIGTTALANLIVEGSIKEVLVDPQKVSLERVITVSVSGGNGKGAILEPIISDQYKEIEFNAAQYEFGGGINISEETITFLENHDLVDGKKIVYSSNGNPQLGVGSFGLSNTDQDLYLINGAIYYPKILNTKSIKLFNTLSDLNSGINTVGFTTVNTGGIHKFRFYDPIRVLSQIRVVDGGEGYANKVLRVKPSGISTQNYTINFKNHGFKDGDIIEYSSTGGYMSGLSTDKQYNVLKVDDDYFRLSEIGGISVGFSKSNYERRKYVKFESSGSGYQVFSYPEVKINIDAEYSQSTGIITATPVVRGKISGVYVYENGTNYGSQILNFNKKPTISLQKGRGAQLKPIVINGRIVKVEVQSRGLLYSKSLDLQVVGNGIGAKLRAVVVNGSITSVIVINGGIGYGNNTKIIINSPGRNAILFPEVRYLTLNNNFRYSDEYLTPREGGMTYGIVGYSTNRDGTQFDEPRSTREGHSKIIGWSRDGYPIYGPYGHNDPKNLNSEIVILKTGYSLSGSFIENRPSLNNFPLGYFVDDYKFTNSGDLDESNGRYAVTPDFPNGTYAYYVGVTSSQSSSNLIPNFPYFIGNSYRSIVSDDFILDQNDDFNETTLLRNTFPHRVSQKYSKSDFIPLLNEFSKQITTIEQTKPGVIDKIDVVNSGQDYAIGDIVVFDNDGSSGSGANAIVSEIYNKDDIVSLETSYKVYENATFVWKDSNTVSVRILPYHELDNNSNVQIIGLSTSLKNITGDHNIKVDRYYSRLTKSLSSAASSGISTDIYVSEIPKNISIGSSITIGSEVALVLNVFEEQNIIKVRRGQTGISHTVSELISYYPNTFEIKTNTNFFDSSFSKTNYFNPQKSVGFGTDVGTITNVQRNIGNYSNQISIPIQSIYIPNHGLKNNQKVLLTISPLGVPISVSNTEDTSGGNTFNLPLSGPSQEVYVINKSKDYIGIVTQVGLTTQTSGLFFIGAGVGGSIDYDDYKIQTQLTGYENITGTVRKIQTKVSISTDHTLVNGDTIKLNVVPNISSGGIETSSSLKISYDSEYNKLLVNRVGFGSTSVSTLNNSISINSHGFYTGQKIFYYSQDANIQNLSKGEYYVYVVDSNTIKLSETYLDSISFPPKLISIGSSGGNIQYVSKINSQILSVKNNFLEFNLSDSSLSGYDFELFYDKEFNKNFVSSGISTIFNITKNGVVGVNGSLKLKFDKNLPVSLYYSLTKNGKSIFTNTNEQDYQIKFINSLYNNTYKISGVAGTHFYISLQEIPEKSYYLKSECETISYSTNSKTSIGPISNISLLNEGSGYKSLPFISGISTSPSTVGGIFGSRTGGKNAVLDIKSKSIGKLEFLNLSSQGYSYVSDNTLRPKADISTQLFLKNADEIDRVEVIEGGKNYISKPNLILLNTSSRKVIDSGKFDVEMSASSISEVKVISKPNGLENVVHQLYTVNNSNGISISGITTYTNGIVHCKLRSPGISAFSTPPFESGDYVFIEGLQKRSYEDEFGNITSPGNGFNSSDHGYNFFRVVEFINSPGNTLLKYDISPYTSYAGDPALSQTVYSVAVNKKNYPVFKLNQNSKQFFENEVLYINGTLTDITVKSLLYKAITITNSDVFFVKKGDEILGSVSGNKCIVGNIIEYDGEFIISSSLTSDLGWKTNVGRLDDDLQVLQDNDYYQNLAYSIKSSKEYNKFSTILNTLAHPAGTKSFANTGISSSAKTSIGSTQGISITLDFNDEKRVDVIKNFDLAFDYDSTTNSSSYIRLLNKKLTDYIECKTNRVLQIDDISNSFSSSEFNKDVFLDSLTYPVTDFYSKFLIQISEIRESDSPYQLSEVVVINDFKNTFTLNKSDVYSSRLLGTFNGEISLSGDPVLRFNPADPYETSYRLKIYREYFNESYNKQSGFKDYGFIRLYGNTDKLLPQVGVSTVIFRGLSTQFNAVYASAIVVDTDNYNLNYYEVVGCYDGTDTHISEFYFDNQKSLGGSSGSHIGTFGLNVSSGVITLDFTNNKTNNILIKSKSVGFGTTASGIGTYRFLVEDQLEETERTSRIESNYSKTVGISSIKIFDSSLESGFRSIVKISVGSTIAMHQVTTICDELSISLQSDPFISVGSPNGIGTFSASLFGSIACINFHPDPKFASSQLTIQSYDHILYKEIDEFNPPDVLTYGSAIERQYLSRYGSINNFGKDRLDFDLNYNRIPIFVKSFNPKKESVLNKETGVFTIKDHFFETGEELIYTPGSTLSNIPPLPVGIGSTLVGGITLIADSIVGFNTLIGLASTVGISTGSFSISGEGFSNGNTTIVSIGETYSYFIGNVTSVGSTVITGIGNTEILKIGSGIYSGNNNSLGTIISIGINSITASSVIPIGSDRLYYSNNLKPALTLSNVSTATTFRKTYSTGITTDICPSKVYAIKIDRNTFKITGVSGGSGIGFTFTNVGSGNLHKFEMVKKMEKSVITVNGVNQYPLTYTSLTYTLSESVGVGTTFIRFSGIGSIYSGDILKGKDEYLNVINVGFGTTVKGPITGIGSIPLVQVIRASLGSTETFHTSGDVFRLYKGAYNIVGNKIWFADAPDGKGNNDVLSENYLPSPKSTFNGRVFLRKDYTGNQIYDDISQNFTGIARTFTLYKNEVPVANAIPGNNLVFINDVFQTPDTQNNTGNNYEILSSPGISSVSFTGIKIPNTNDVFTVDYDVNQNELPRGGILVSLAFTGGLGYAPLVGIPSSMIDLKVGAGGSIRSIGFTTSIVVGIATTGMIGINTDVITGITTTSISVGQKVIDILNEQTLNLVNPIVPNLTRFLQYDTLVSSIGINSIFISKSTTNNVAFSTTFGFDIGPIIGSGYYNTISIGITDSLHNGTPANIKAFVGSGGTVTSFNIVSGGSGYVNPYVAIPDPSYERLPIVGVSKVSVGNTTKCGIGVSLTFSVSPSIEVGVNSTYYRISDYELNKSGYGFELGDIFQPVGLTTAQGLQKPITPILFTVTDIKADSFASWQVGEFDYIDNIKQLQDGIRTRFPLYKNGELLSFEINRLDPDSSLIDFDSVLLIYINGVMQEPDVSYRFTGGTTFSFLEAPKPSDNISIFFYRGTSGVDSVEVDITQTIKPGDSVQINKNDLIPQTIGQDPRLVSYILSSDIFETGIYLGDGVDQINPRPINLITQKRDLIINETFYSKERDSIEPLVFPTAKIIKSFTPSDNFIFVDDAQFFNYEENNFGNEVRSFDGLVIANQDPVSAAISAVVSTGSTSISSISIINGGSGYLGIGNSILLKTRSVGVGGSNAIIYATVSSAGTITSPINIVSPGFGYTHTNPPQVIAPVPTANKEIIKDIIFVDGFSGIITGITTTSGIGTDLAIKFFVKYDQDYDPNTLKVGYPIYVFDTTVGSGLTSIDSNNTEKVAIGTEYCNNIYYVHSITNLNLQGSITCNIMSNSNITGISTFGNTKKGEFSWGRFSGLKRSDNINSISVNLNEYTTSVGLTTYPTIQRRKFGLRSTGALSKIDL